MKPEDVKVGDYISISPYSDWYSYKVIRRTPKTLICQENGDRKFIESWEDGRMSSEDDPHGDVITLRWSHKRNRWVYNTYRVAMGKYDYEDPSF